jgi:colanic acid/amylovoran biosynthesis protein
MNTYGVVGGTLWGNRGAEAMVATTIGRVRERDPGAAFVLLSYYPRQDRQLISDPGIEVVDARPVPTVLTWLGALACRLTGGRLPDAVLPAPVRALRRCRALFDVSGISFYDRRLPVVAYNLLCSWPALLLKVPVVRLTQAMGPFRRLLNRLPARWVTRRSLHTFARGRLTAAHLEQLGAPAESWSVAADVAFAYRPEFSLTVENEQQVARLRERLAGIRASGTEVVGLVPSSVVDRKLAKEGGDYLALLVTLVRDLHQRGLHVLVLPNATRAAVAAARNNDLAVITRLRQRLAAQPEGIDQAVVRDVVIDHNTA